MYAYIYSVNPASATTSIGRTIQVPGSLLFNLTHHTGRIFSLAILSYGNLASGSMDYTIKIWDPYFLI